MRFRMVEAAVSPQIFREYPMLMRYRHYPAAQARLAARLESCPIVSAESPSGTTADARPVSVKISYGKLDGAIVRSACFSSRPHSRTVGRTRRCRRPLDTATPAQRNNGVGTTTRRWLVSCHILIPSRRNLPNDQCPPFHFYKPKQSPHPRTLAGFGRPLPRGSGESRLPLAEAKFRA